MQISNNYVVVEKLEEVKKEGFEVVNIQDNFVCRGKVVNIPEAPIYMGNERVMLGSTILFAKYSPDTHEVDLEDKKVKFINVSDILAIL